LPLPTEAVAKRWENAAVSPVARLPEVICGRTLEAVVPSYGRVSGCAVTVSGRAAIAAVSPPGCATV
jgi:hypothetical protein